MHLTVKVGCRCFVGVCGAPLLFLSQLLFSFYPLTIIAWVVGYFLRILVIFLRFFFEITVDNFLLSNFFQKLLMLFVFV